MTSFACLELAPFLEPWLSEEFSLELFEEDKLESVEQADRVRVAAIRMQGVMWRINNLHRMGATMRWANWFLASHWLLFWERTFT